MKTAPEVPILLILFALSSSLFAAEPKIRWSGHPHVQRVIAKDLFAAPVDYNLDPKAQGQAACVRALTDPEVPTMSCVGSEPSFERPYRRGIEMARDYARALVETKSPLEVVYFIRKLGWPYGSSGFLVDAKTREVKSFLGVHTGISGIPEQSALRVDAW